jgi:lantibiotic modifying enzyme
MAGVAMDDAAALDPATSHAAARYRAAAHEVADWLGFAAIAEGRGVTWPAVPAETVPPGSVPPQSVPPESVPPGSVPGESQAPEPSLGWGALGPMVFFADGYRTIGDLTWLEHANAGASWLRGRLASPDPDLPPGLFTGLAGFAVVFNELNRLGVTATQEDLARVFELLATMAEETSSGVNWLQTTEVLWGTAGIGFVLLSIGRQVIGDQALDLAVRAGDWLLAAAYHTPEGLRWDLGEGVARRRPQARETWFPNFAHGTAGIAAFLARLGAAANDERYVDAARGAAAWILTTCRTEGGTCAAQHHNPAIRHGDVGFGPARADGDESPVFTMGWCHGPPGLGWFFRELQLATGDQAWAQWIARTAKAVRDSGIPERREPGFWDNVGRCCGSAGVAEYFLDLHTWRQDPADLAFAVTLVDDLLDRAIVDEHGMRWSNVEFRADPPGLPPETTFFQGASGIGSTLLRLSRHLEGDLSVVGWPHAPDWSGTRAPAGA